MTKTVLISFLIWSWGLLTSLVVLFSMFLWALGKSLPIVEAVTWSASAHIRNRK